MTEPKTRAEDEPDEKAKLLDVKKLRELIAALDLDDRQKTKIENVWLDYIRWWDVRSRRAKKNYERLRGAVVIAGALVPALVGLRELKAWGRYDWVFAVASVVASLVVAICAGLEGLFNFGGIWREKRIAGEVIKCEGFSFFDLSGEYVKFKTHAAAYKLFSDNVNRLIRSEAQEYQRTVAPKNEDDEPDDNNGNKDGKRGDQPGDKNNDQSGDETNKPTDDGKEP